MSMTYYAVTDDPNELAHWGIKGMKWGVRRTDAQLGHPRHTGSRRPRSAAYKKAQSKLGMMMRNGIKKAEAHWKAYNSPKAKEERFMKKAMQQARTGTLKYGKLTDDQVRRVTERLALERNARQLGSTENPKFAKRIKIALGEGVVRGVGLGTASYIDARMRGRGETTAAIKKDKRMAKYEASISGRRAAKRKAKNDINEEYYKTAYEEGFLPVSIRGARKRAKYLENVKKRSKDSDYKASIQKVYDEQNARARAINDAKSFDDIQRGIRAHREDRKLMPSKVEYTNPVTGKKVIGTKVERLNAYNEGHENANRIGNKEYDSAASKYALSVRQQNKAAERQFATNQVMQEYAKTQRQRKQEAAVRENARIQQEQARAARLDEVKKNSSGGGSRKKKNRTARKKGYVVYD